MSPRSSIARLNVAAQIVFAMLFAGAIVLSVSSCEPRSAVTPLSETSHVHYHVHGPDIQHDHVHKDFASGGHSHAHQHSRTVDLP